MRQGELDLFAWPLRRLNQLIEHFEATLGPSTKNFQISLRGLLLTTTIASVLFAIAARFMTYRAEVLGGIYLLGPWLLIAIAFVPQRIPWEQRAAILIPAALLLMGGAVFVGAKLTPPVDFDKVLLGIFICWTPQSVLVALAISLSILIFYRPR